MTVGKDQRDTTPSDDRQAKEAPAPKKKPRKRRRWLRVLAVVLVLLVLLVALAPMIASTGPAREAILSSVNKDLFGEIQVDDWSFGWLSGQRVEGVRVIDPDGATVLTVDRVAVPVRLLDLALGSRDLGTIRVTAVQADVVAYDDNTTNLQRALEKRRDADEDEDDDEDEDEDEPDQAPAFRGKVIVEKITGTLAGHQVPETVTIAGNLSVDFLKGLEQPVTAKARLELSAGGQTGKVDIDGQATPYHDGVVDLKKLTGELTVKLTDLPAAMANMIVERGDKPMRFTHGTAGGELTATVNGIEDITIGGNLDGRDIALYMPAREQTLRLTTVGTTLSIRPRPRRAGEPEGLPPIAGSLNLTAFTGELAGNQHTERLSWDGTGSIKFPDGLAGAIENDLGIRITSGRHSGQLAAKGRVTLPFTEAGGVDVPRIAATQTLTLTRVPPGLLSALGGGQLPEAVSDGKIDGHLALSAVNGLDQKMALNVDLTLATASGVSRIATEDPSRADARTIPTTITLPWRDGKPVAGEVLVRSWLNITDLPVELANAFMRAEDGTMKLVGGKLNATLDADVATLDNVNLAGRLEVVNASARMATTETPVDGDAPVEHVHTIRVDRLAADVDLKPIAPVDANDPAARPLIPVVGPVKVAAFDGRFESTKLGSPVRWTNDGRPMSLEFKEGDVIEQAGIRLLIADAEHSGTLTASGMVQLFKDAAGKLDLPRTRLQQAITLADLPAGVLAALRPGAQVPADVLNSKLAGGVSVDALRGLDRAIHFTGNLSLAGGTIRVRENGGNLTLPWTPEGDPDLDNLAGNLGLDISNFPVTLANLAGTDDKPAAVRFDRGVVSGNASVRALNLRDIRASGQLAAVGIGGLLAETGDTLNVARADFVLGDSSLVGDRLTIGGLDVSVTLAGGTGQAVKLSARGSMPLENVEKSGDAADEPFEFTAGGMLDLAAIINHLPNLARQKLKLREDMTLTAGRLELTSAKMAGAGDSMDITAEGRLTGVAGQVDGRAVSLDPIAIQLAKAHKQGDTWSLSGPGATLTADWGSLNARGGLDTLAVTTPKPFDLGRLHAQLSQFIDMGDLRFSGVATLVANSKSAGEGEPIELEANLSASDLVVAGLGDKELRDNPVLTMRAKLERNAAADFSAIVVESAKLTSQIANVDKASARLEHKQTGREKDGTPIFEWVPTALNADATVVLERLTDTFGATMGLRPGSRIAGSARITTGGRQDGDVLKLDPRVVFSGLDIHLPPAPPEPTEDGQPGEPGEPFDYKADRLVVSSDNVQLNAAEKWLRIPAASADVPDFERITLSDVEVRDWGQDGRKPKVSGKATVVGDLAKLPIPPAALGDWTLGGRIELAADARTDEAGGMTVLADATLDNFTGTKPPAEGEGTEPIRVNLEKLTLTTGGKSIRRSADGGEWAVPLLKLRATGANGAEVASIDVDDLLVEGLASDNPADRMVTIQQFKATADADAVCQRCGSLVLTPGTNFRGRLSAEGHIRRQGDRILNAQFVANWLNMQVTRPKADGSGMRTLREPSFTIAAMGVIDQAAEAIRFNTLSIDSQSKFVSVNVTQGSLNHYADPEQRRLVAKGRWEFNGESMKTFLGDAWPEDLTVASAAEGEDFDADLPLNEKWRTEGRFETRASWNKVAFKGFTVGQPATPMEVRLSSGRLTASRTQMPANNGTMTVLADVDVNRKMQPAWMTWRHKPEDIHSYVPWLTIRRQTDPLPLLDSVNINEQMSDEIVEVIKRAVPAFLAARQFSGLMDLQIDEADMPLDGEVLKKTGRLTGKVRVRNFRVQGGLLSVLSRGMRLNLATEEGALVEQPIEIRDGKVYIRNSKVNFGGSHLTFNGWVALVDEEDIEKMNLRPEQTMQMMVTFVVTQELLEQYAGAQAKIIGKDFVKYVGDAPITIPLKGTPGDPQFDASAVPKAIAPLAAKAVSQYLLDRATKNAPKPEAAEGEAEPAPPAEGEGEEPKPKKPEDVIRDVGIGILKDIFKKKKDEDGGE